MLPAYKYTEYTSPNGNTKIMVYHQKPTARQIARHAERSRLLKQRLLGVLCLVICAVYPLLMNGDATVWFIFFPAALACLFAKNAFI